MRCGERAVYSSLYARLWSKAVVDGGRRLRPEREPWRESERERSGDLLTGFGFEWVHKPIAPVHARAPCSQDHLAAGPGAEVT